MLDKLKTKKWMLLALIIGGLALAMAVAIPASVVLHANSKVATHLGKPVTFSDVVISESGNVCIGFKQKKAFINLMTYYYTIPDGDIRMRPNGSDVMIKVDD